MTQQGIEWFRNARFGMFLHWGLYALPGGRWKGETMDYIGEWIQSRFRIPNREYAELAKRFNPAGFDAAEWIRLAKAAGIRYIVYTAKHHDGFAMYHSKVSAFNITDATPFGRDPLRELADACREQQVGLGIYYSHHLDWHEPDGGDPSPACGKNRDGMSWGNDWDFPDRKAKNFDRYFEGKALPQITELLTGYGPVAELWCDCPLDMDRKYSEKLRALVKQLQPECMINSRIGNGCGDFESLGDNQIMLGRAALPAESPITLNDTWGFKYDDHNWKSPEFVARRLASLADRNANCLLNIGPGPDGRFPDGAVAVLKALAPWHRETAGMISGSTPNPFPQELPWGYCTATGNRLNLFIRDWTTPLRLNGIRNRVTAASVPFRQEGDSVILELPARQLESLLPTVTVTLDGPPRIDSRLMPQNGTLNLAPGTGRLIHGNGSADGVSTAAQRDEAGEATLQTQHSLPVRDGTLAQWHNPDDAIEWEVVFPEGGSYRVEVETVQRLHSHPWIGGRRVELCWNDNRIEAELRCDRITDPGSYHPAAASEIGTIQAAAGDTGILRLRTTALTDPAAGDMNLVGVWLTRI